MSEFDDLYEKALANPYPIKRRIFPTLNAPSDVDRYIENVLRGKLPTIEVPLGPVQDPRFDFLAKKVED